MTQLFGRLKPGTTIDEARVGAERDPRRHSRPSIRSRIPQRADMRLGVAALRDQIAAPARPILLVLLAAAGGRLHHRLLERRQPDPRAIGSPRRRARGSRRARRQPRRAAANAAGGEPGAVRRRRGARRAARAADGRDRRELCRAILGARARSHGRFQPAVGRRRRSRWRRRCCSRMCRGCRRRSRRPATDSPPAAFASRPAPIAACRCSRRRRSRSRSCCWPARRRCWRRWSRLQTREHRLRHASRCWRSICRCRRSASATDQDLAFYQQVTQQDRRAARRRGRVDGQLHAVA